MTHKHDDEARAAAARKRLGEAIRRRREALHLSEAEVAKASSIPIVDVTAIETGERSVDYDVLLAIASCLKVIPAQLVWTAERDIYVSDRRLGKFVDAIDRLLDVSVDEPPP